jgi:hypothetical protein
VRKLASSAAASAVRSVIMSVFSRATTGTCSEYMDGRHSQRPGDRGRISLCPRPAHGVWEVLERLGGIALTAARTRYTNPGREANETPLADPPAPLQSAADYGRPA